MKIGLKLGIDDFAALLIGYFLGAEVAQHFVGDPVGDLGPDIDDFVVTLAVGDQTVFILLFDFADVVVGFFEQLFLARRNHHVFDGNRNSRLRRVLDSRCPSIGRQE